MTLEKRARMPYDQNMDTLVAPSLTPELTAKRDRLLDGLRGLGKTAVAFSGGIDSTLIAHYARQFRPEAPGYFVGGMNAPDYRFAAAYADQTGYDLRLVPFDPRSDEAFAMIDQVVEVTESFEPNLIRGAVCSLAAAQHMHRDGFRVALCGEGADELFCGYAPLEVAFHESAAEGQPIRDECLDLMNRVSLQRVDRCSMRYQVETREPFLDPAVVKYALNLDVSARASMSAHRILPGSGASTRRYPMPT